MERPALTLVTGGEPAPRATPWGAVLGGAILAFAALAAGNGAFRARAPFDPRRIAEDALARAWGDRDAGAVTEALARLDARLLRCPRDAATRTIRASLLLESGAGAGSREEALAEVRRAVGDDPQGVGVRRAAAWVEARCGLWEAALADLRAIFALDPGEGSAALLDVEPLLPARRLEEALPEEPAAWRAWSIRLRESGRSQEADARLGSALARWPDDLVSRTIAAGAAAGSGDTGKLRQLVPPELTVPEAPANALLIAFRARSRSLEGDAAGARADAVRAVALSGGDPWVSVAAGDAVLAQEPALARSFWNPALFALEGQPGRIWVLARLARLDEADGRASDAVRRWREVLVLRPGEAEALRRLEALGVR